VFITQNKFSYQMSRTIDFHRESKTPSIYKYSMVNPQSGGNTLSLAGLNQPQVVFELPSQAFNLSRTYLNFDYIVPAQGAGRCAWLWQDVLSLVENMRLRTSSNIELMRLENVRMFTKLLKKDIDLSKYLTMDNYEILHSHRGEAKWGENKFPDGVTSLPLLHPAYLQSAGRVQAPDPAQQGQFIDVNEPSRLQRVRFNLGALIGTIFELDKSLYFPESLFLHVTFGPWNRIGFRGGSITNASTQRAALDTANNTLDISNLHLALAIEDNKDVISLLMNTVNSTGLSLQITIQSFVNPIQGSQQTVTVRLASGMGQKLRRIFHTCIRQDYEADFKTAYNISNATYQAANDSYVPDNVSSYYVMVDNNRVSGEFDIDCARGEDWLVNRKHLQKSVIQSRDDYEREWHHQQDFSGIREDPSETVDGVSKDNISDGLDLLTKERKIDIFMRMGANHGGNAEILAMRNHYTFAEIERTLHISQSAIGLDIMGSALVA